MVIVLKTAEKRKNRKENSHNKVRRWSNASQNHLLTSHVPGSRWRCPRGESTISIMIELFFGITSILVSSYTFVPCHLIVYVVTVVFDDASLVLFFFGTFPSLLERIVLTCPRKAHENVIVTPVNRNEVNNKVRKSRQWMSLRFTTETKIWQQKKSKSCFLREWFIKSWLCQLSGRLFWSQEPRWQRSIAYRFLEQPIETCRPTWPSAAAQC